MKLSTKSQYGLRALYVMAGIYPDGKISASGLEKEIYVSSKYLERILRMLCVAGIVEAERGASGGYKLKREPSSITIGEIVRALEDNMEIVGCLSSDCGCPSKHVWQKLAEGINNVLDGMTLQSMLDDNCANCKECNADGKNGK